MKIRKTILEASELNTNKVVSDKDVVTINKVTALIRDEWEAIEGYQRTIQDMKSAEMPQEVIDVLQSISTEELAHVGELHKILNILNPDAENHIEQGKLEAEEIIN